MVEWLAGITFEKRKRPVYPGPLQYGRKSKTVVAAAYSGEGRRHRDEVEAMNEFIGRMFALDTNGLILVVLICALGCLIMRSVMPIAGLAVASFPLLVLSSLAAYALLLPTYLVGSLEKAPGIALSTGIGMIAATIFIVAAVRVLMLMCDLFGRRPELLSPRPAEPRAPQPIE